ncbi:hypothetical protein L3Q82_026125, partial [Scortum barcoo]
MNGGTLDRITLVAGCVSGSTGTNMSFTVTPVSMTRFTWFHLIQEEDDSLFILAADLNAAVPDLPPHSQPDVLHAAGKPAEILNAVFPRQFGEVSIYRHGSEPPAGGDTGRREKTNKPLNYPKPPLVIKRLFVNFVYSHLVRVDDSEQGAGQISQLRAQTDIRKRVCWVRCDFSLAGIYQEAPLFSREFLPPEAEDPSCHPDRMQTQQRAQGSGQHLPAPAPPHCIHQLLQAQRPRPAEGRCQTRSDAAADVQSGSR